MSGSNKNIGLEESTDEVFKKAKNNTPQLTLIEAIAWLKAGTAVVHQGMVYDPFKNDIILKNYAQIVSIAERTFTVPVYQSLSKHSSDKGIGAALVRWMRYVWIDATATSALVSALHTNNLKKDGLEHSRFNSLYPLLLVSLPGAILKVVLVAVAIAATPIMIIAAAVAYVTGFREATGAIMSAIGAVVGLIATVPRSNINPFFALKTIFFDPYKSMQIINANNARVKKGNALPRELGTRELTHNVMTNLTGIHKENIAGINATFKIDGGLRTDWVTNATKMFSGAYVIKPKLAAWDPRNFARKELVLEIRSADNKKILGTMHTKISSDNNIRLQFTNEADAYAQDILSVGFTKMAQEIARAANSKEPIKLDISNIGITEERITANIRGLNKGMGVPIEFEDRKRETSTDARISDEIEDKKPETHEDNDVPKDIRHDDYRMV